MKFKIALYDDTTFQKCLSLSLFGICIGVIDFIRYLKKIHGAF